MNNRRRLLLAQQEKEIEVVRPLVLFDGENDFEGAENWTNKNLRQGTTTTKQPYFYTTSVRAWLCYNQPLTLLPTDIIKITTSRHSATGTRTMALTNYLDNTQGMGGTISIAYYKNTSTLDEYAMWYTKTTGDTILEFVPKNTYDFSGNVDITKDNSDDHDALTIYIIQEQSGTTVPSLEISKIEIVDSRTL